MVEFNGSGTSSLDEELSASVKKILLQQIAFKDAQVPDEGDILNHKYKPLNSRYNQQNANSSKLLNQTSKTALVSNDIPTPPTLIYPAEKVVLEWKEMRRIGPGLANLGNTCFLNSVLQVLTYTPPLVNYVLSGYHKSKCRIVGFCMQCELSAHINRIMHHNAQMGAIRPMSIIQKLQCIGKNFRFGRQEDAHEFLRYVVEGIQKSDYADKPKLDKLSKETTVANAIFGGFYRSQVKCLHCNYESNTFDPMMDLNMDIKDCSSILQTLQKSVRPDRLDGDNKYFCEKCRTKRVAQKRGNIHREPNVLTLVLKRFDFSKMFGGKISKDVSFPEELNIRPFMSNSQGDPVIYKLYGILVHSGYSCNSGHYYCYVKASNGTWFEMNDSRVCQVGLQTVLRAQAYMLFYVKSTQNKRLVATPKPIISSNVNLKKYTQRPEIKPVVGISTSDKKPLINESINPLGVSVKRKIEPKINWANKDKGTLGVGHVASMLNMPSKNDDSSNNNVRGDGLNKSILEAKTLNQNKENTAKLSENSGYKVEGNCTKGSKMNSLQKLSESYEDSDEVESRGSSPINKEVEESKGADIYKTEMKDEAVCKKLPNPEEKESNMKIGESRPPFKLTLKNGKQFIHNKLNIWSPITKGTLYPRAILNKCMLDNESESKVHLSAKKKKITDSSWKEEKISTPEKLFGPLMPPPPGTKCEGSNSITSETSSAGSVQTQSGDWDVLDKGCETVVAPIIPNNQPPGWNVSPSSQNNMNTSGSESHVMTNGIDDSKLKKKKKKKKKRRHHSDDIFPGKVKQKVCISIENGTKQELTLENTDRHDRKKKKVQLESTISLPLIQNLSDSVEIYKKKKKDKKKRYSLLIDTNSNNIGKLYSIPCHLDKYLSKYKVKSEVGSNDSYEHNIPSKVVKNYSPKPPAHSFSSDEDKIYEKENCQQSEQNVNKSNKVNYPLSQLEDRYLLSPNANVADNGNFNPPKSAVSSHESKETKEHCEPLVKSAISAVKPQTSPVNQGTKSTYSKDGNCSHRKKVAPTHVWDDPKKKHFAWDGSSKNDTMEHLLGSGPNVKSWDGGNKSYFYHIKKHGENPQDEWDEEYDRGKVKKKRKLDDEYENHAKSKSNSFQDFQNHKNRYKDKDKDKHSHRSSKHHYSDHRHHSKKRKVYDGDRYV